MTTTPEVSSIRDADRIIGLLEGAGIKQIDLLVNRVRMDMVRRGEMMSVEDVVDILAVNLLGAVPDEESVVIAANHGEPVVLYVYLFGQAYLNICRRICGETVPLLDLSSSSSWLKKVSAFLKRR